MRSPFFGEFMGTLVLILLGNGVVAGVLLKRSKAENSGWMVIATGWAFAVLCGVFTAVLCGSQDAHLNPAITLAMAFQSGDYSKLMVYIPAQMLGAFVGAALVWLHYFPHWKITEDAELKRLTSLHCSCHPESACQSLFRSARHRSTGLCCGIHDLQAGALYRPCCRPLAVFGRVCCLVHRSFPWRNNRLRDQSCSRSGTAHCACNSSHRWKRTQ